MLVIGVGSTVVNNKASGRAWSFIAEVQHEQGAFVSNGLEVAAKNKSTDNFTYKPYQATFGVFGTRYVAGGDNAFGGDSENPSTAAVIIIKNETSSHGWNSGIVFTQDALETNEAVSMARTHQIKWYAPDNQTGAIITSNVSSTANQVKMQFVDNFVNFVGSNGKQFFRSAHATNGVNYTEVGSGQTGVSPYIASAGDDADIDLAFTPKGAGVVRFGSHTAIGSETVTGYITIKDSSGNIRKLAVVA